MVWETLSSEQGTVACPRPGSCSRRSVPVGILRSSGILRPELRVCAAPGRAAVVGLNERLARTGSLVREDAALNKQCLQRGVGGGEGNRPRAGERANRTVADTSKSYEETKTGRCDGVIGRPCRRPHSHGLLSQAVNVQVILSKMTQSLMSTFKEILIKRKCLRKPKRRPFLRLGHVRAADTGLARPGFLPSGRRAQPRSGPKCTWSNFHFG